MEEQMAATIKPPTFKTPAMHELGQVLTSIPLEFVYDFQQPL